jgi:hypothetical protein
MLISNAYVYAKQLLYEQQQHYACIYSLGAYTLRIHCTDTLSIAVHPTLLLLLLLLLYIVKQQ